MCDLHDTEELKKYTRRDFAAFAASGLVLGVLISIRN
jgi:hypothetical protein